MLLLGSLRSPTAIVAGAARGMLGLFRTQTFLVEQRPAPQGKRLFANYTARWAQLAAELS